MKNLFDLTDRVFVITGATGALAGSAADYLVAQGARIAFLGRSREKLDASLAKCRAITPSAECVGLVADVLDRPALEQARDAVIAKWGRIDGLVNGTGGKVRVNSVMPGFFLGEQNRRLLTNEDGSLTDRGHAIISNTPFGRFGQADELFGALHYLLSDASQFVTGTVLAVDGGFVAFSGV